MSRQAQLSTEERVKVFATPSAYATVELRRVLYPWQAVAMDGLVRPGSRVGLCTCNESGKTSEVIADACVWHMGAFLDSLTITTSGSWRQIEGQLYPALRARSSRLRGKWRVLQDRAVCEDTGSVLRSFSTDDPLRAEGWHEMEREELWQSGENLLRGFGVSDEEWGKVKTGRTSLLMVIDEAKAVDKRIFEAFERCHPTRLLVASSPGEDSGPFYDVFHADRARYLTVHVSAEECPHLWEDAAKRAELEAQIERFGEESPLVKSMIRGTFASSGEYTVFDMAAVARAQSGTLPRYGLGERRFALDLSGGGDEAPLYLRDGNEARLVRSWHEPDDDKLVREVITELQRLQLRPEWGYVDEGGLGGPIVNAFARKRWELNRINFAGKPRNPRWYANARAEMYFELAHRVKKDEVLLPADDLLRQQLAWQKYLPGTALLQLVPKEKLPGSPDRADTVAMLFYDMAEATQYADRKRQVERGRAFTMLGEKPEDEHEGGGLWQ